MKWLWVSVGLVVPLLVLVIGWTVVAGMGQQRDDYTLDSPAALETHDSGRPATVQSNTPQVVQVHQEPDWFEMFLIWNLMSNSYRSPWYEQRVVYVPVHVDYYQSHYQRPAPPVRGVAPVAPKAPAPAPAPKAAPPVAPARPPVAPAPKPPAPRPPAPRR